MKIIKPGSVSGLVLILVLGGAGASAAATGKMTREEYRARLAQYTQREDTAKGELARLETDIAALQSELEGLESDIASLNREILGMVEATEAEIEAYGGKLDVLLRQLEGLGALSSEELFQRRDELEDIAAQVAEFKQNKICALPAMKARVKHLESLLAELNARRPREFSLDYEVARGDNLWNIARQEKVYADPYMWPRIYRANREKIKDPDLIYPKQVLSIPFGVAENQYLVVGGDFLSAIAAAVYNDPTKWHKIYEANKEQIVEPGLIFPAQVFDIPAN